MEAGCIEAHPLASARNKGDFLYKYKKVCLQGWAKNRNDDLHG
jgi:hypothetical protein